MQCQIDHLYTGKCGDTAVATCIKCLRPVCQGHSHTLKYLRSTEKKLIGDVTGQPVALPEGKDEDRLCTPCGVALQGEGRPLAGFLLR